MQGETLEAMKRAVKRARNALGAVALDKDLAEELRTTKPYTLKQVVDALDLCDDLEPMGSLSAGGRQWLKRLTAWAKAYQGGKPPQF